MNDVCYGMFDLYGIPIPFSVLNKSVQLFIVLGLYDFRISVFLYDQAGRYGPYGFTISLVLFFLSRLLWKPSRLKNFLSLLRSSLPVWP